MPKIGPFIVLFGVLTGVPLGLGGFTFYYAEGLSYLSNDPKACINCHIMKSQYDNWLRSSHKSIATCNDCHTPAGFIGKYTSKASNGFWHSWAFTTGKYNDPIEIKPHNRRIVETSCRHCHKELLESSHLLLASDQISCTKCHSQVGHGR